ncbi:SMP-30/gluconolactonase/LRE family protein [Thermodesulfobacteriota bacterium]
MQIRYEIHDERFNDLFDTGEDLKTITTGFRFLEGPVWHPYDHVLIFSDILANCLYKYSQDKGISTLRGHSYMANGNTLDRQGRLLTCEHATSRVTRAENDGSVEVLAFHYEGKALNSPNDIVVKGDDGIYFTDPNSGREPRVGVPREKELPFQGVFRINRDGTLILLADDFSKPNGLCFSKDEKQLFVNDTDRQHIRVFDVREDGTLANGRVWAELTVDLPGVADGMKIDSEGNLYCAGPGGIHVFDPDARLLGRVFLPEFAANFTWGGDDLRTLYLAGSTALYRLRVKTPGRQLFYR